MTTHENIVNAVVAPESPPAAETLEYTAPTLMALGSIAANTLGPATSGNQDVIGRFWY